MPAEGLTVESGKHACSALADDKSTGGRTARGALMGPTLASPQDGENGEKKNGMSETQSLSKNWRQTQIKRDTQPKEQRTGKTNKQRGRENGATRWRAGKAAQLETGRNTTHDFLNGTSE